MKPIKLIIGTLFFSLLFTVIVSSCSKKDEDNAKPNDPIMGTWNLTPVYDGTNATV